MKKKEKIPFGILSFVSSISGLISLFLIPIISIVFFILAIILAIVQKKYKSDSFAKAGLIIGVLGIIIYILIGFSSFQGPFSNYNLTS
ncbi:MAG: hypothetical protein P8X70_01665 [Nanoarchaeota archaeon]|jgi:hypothetical protein